MDVFKILNAAKRLIDAARTQDWGSALRAVGELLTIAGDLFGPKTMSTAKQNKSIRDARKVTDEELAEVVAGLDSLAPPAVAASASASADPEAEPVELDPATIAILIQLGLAIAKRLVEWIRKRRQQPAS